MLKNTARWLKGEGKLVAELIATAGRADAAGKQSAVSNIAEQLTAVMQSNAGAALNLADTALSLANEDTSVRERAMGHYPKPTRS